MCCYVKQVLFWIGSVLFRDDAPKVIYYHDIGQNYTPMGTSKDLFWAHIQCLRRDDKICFDDGFRGLWDEREHIVSAKIRPIVFLAIDLVGKPGYLNWDEVRWLQNECKFEFQCHTWSHQTLAGPWNKEVPVPETGRTERWFHHELIDSKIELERQLNKKVTAICFPVGYFSDDVIRRCRIAGYETVYTSYPGNRTDDFVQPRCLAQDLNENEFLYVLHGGMRLFRNRYLRKHKHDIDKDMAIK